MLLVNFHLVNVCALHATPIMRMRARACLAELTWPIK